LQRAYQKPTYIEAKSALRKIHAELEERNLSSAASLEEGLEETLTLHRLGVFEFLGRSFKTTNCIESVMSGVEERCGKVDCWKNAAQKQRWLAASLLDIEPRLRRVYLRGLQNIAKRYLIHVCGYNLGILMRRRFGVGTLRVWASRVRAGIKPVFRG